MIQILLDLTHTYYSWHWHGELITIFEWFVTNKLDDKGGGFVNADKINYSALNYFYQIKWTDPTVEKSAIIKEVEVEIVNLVGKCYKVVNFRKHSDFITEKTKEHIVARYVNGIGTCILLHTLSSQQQWLEALWCAVCG